MNISKISIISFNGGSQVAKVEPRKTDKAPETIDSNNNNNKSNKTAYVIGGVAVTAATIMSIVGYKKGWFSKAAKSTVKEGEELLNRTHEAPTSKPGPVIKPAEEPKPKTETEIPLAEKEVSGKEAEVPVSESEDIAKQEQEFLKVDEEAPKPEISKQEGEILNSEVNSGEEIVKQESKNSDPTRITDNEVIDALENSDKIEELKLQEKLAKMPKYLTKYMSPEMALKGIEDGSITPLKRALMFIKEFDNNIEGLIRELNSNYPVINNINKGIRRTKQDFVDAFDSWIADTNSGFRSTYKVIGNTIHEARPDGSKVIYAFEKGEDGGLMLIRDIPSDSSKLTVVTSFDPTRYKDFGTGIGIHHLDKLEFFNAKTGKLVQSIEIDPVERSFHNVKVNNPENGNPVLTLNRTAEPDHLYYDVELFNSETGERISKINTKNLSEEQL